MLLHPPLQPARVERKALMTLRWRGRFVPCLWAANVTITLSSREAIEPHRRYRADVHKGVPNPLTQFSQSHTVTEVMPQAYPSLRFWFD